MIPVLLGLVAAACFGAMTVAVREGLLRVPDPAAATFVSVTVGLVVTLPLALAMAGVDGIKASQVWPSLVAGLIAPGVAGLLFTLAVDLAGAARAALLVTAAPLLAAVPAFLLLDEPFHLALAAGGALIVAGGIVLGGERLEGTAFRRVGLVVALAAAALIAVRDNFARWTAEHYDLSGVAAGSAALAGASAFLLVYLLLTRREDTFAAIRRAAIPFLPAGLLIAAAYAALFEALKHGRVTVVTPLYATESLWTVVLAAIFLGRSERIGPRLLVATGLMVGGAALIGAFR